MPPLCMAASTLGYIVGSVFLLYIRIEAFVNTLRRRIPYNLKRVILILHYNVSIDTKMRVKPIFRLL